MKLVEIVKEGLHMEKGTPWEMNLKKGKYYLISNLIVQQLSMIMPNHINRIMDLAPFYRRYNGESLDGKSILVWRHGGIGDLMFMMAPLRVLKALYPTSQIHVAIGGKYMDVYQDIPYVDFLHQLPFEKGLLDQADYHLHFEQIIEGNPKAERMNAYDLFFERFSFNPAEIPDSEKIPDVFLNTIHEQWGKETIERFKIDTNTTLIGIQLAASSPIRTYPTSRYAEIIDMLMKDDSVKVILFGSPNQAALSEPIIDGMSDEYKERIIDGPKHKFSLKQTMTITKYCSVVVAPDSAMIHIAGAMRVPVIGLYGPFPANLRMKTYYNAIGLNAVPVCAPCFTHDHDPCPKGNPSPCFSLIDPLQVCFAIDYLLEKSQGRILTNIREQKRSMFDTVLEQAKPWMEGEGIDVGCGFQEYPTDIDIVRVDVDPLVSPDVVANYFTDYDIAMHSLDYVVCSFVLDAPDDLVSFMKITDALIRPGGVVILYCGDAAFVKGKRIKEFPSNFTKSFFSSQLDHEKIMKIMEGFPNYNLVEEKLPEPTEDQLVSLFETNHGIFQVWKKGETNE